MSKKIWVVTELYYPEETSTGYFLTKIAEGLSGHYPVSVLCVPPTYSERGARVPTRERYNGVDIRRCKATAFSKNITILRLINILSISLSIFTNLIFHIKRQDVVLVVTNPPTLPFLTALACRLRGSKYLLLVHDVYPEALVAAGMIREYGLVAKLGRWLTRELYSKSNRIIVLGRDMKQLVLKKMSNRNAERIAIIPNWADTEFITPRPKTRNTFLINLGLQDKFIVQYSGNMGRTHGLETIVETASLLRSQTNVHFLLCGSGAKMPWLQAVVAKEKLQNMTILPRQPRSELNDLLNAADVSIIALIPGMVGVSVPSRMYNILAAGKPIIAITELNSELALVIQEEKVGWIVPPGQCDVLAQIILTVRTNLEDLRIKGEKARAVAEKKYTLDRVISAYNSLINESERGN